MSENSCNREMTHKQLFLGQEIKKILSACMNEEDAKYLDEDLKDL